MDRDRIQRRDFPTGRKGYDIAAVDEHLRRVADAFESNAPPPAPSLAATTSDQVRQILEAAERSVADVHARANEEASDHVARVQEATSGMLAKLDQLESELNRLLGALRTSGERLNQGLAELQSQVAGGAFPPPPDLAPAPEPSAPAAAPEPPADASPAPAADAPAADAPAADASPAPAADAPPAPAADAPSADASPAPAADAPRNGTAPAPAADASPVPTEDSALLPLDDSLFDLPAPESARTDEAGARLVALNMALSGSPREDTALFLAEHFDLPDVEGLLDDVYAKAGP